MPAPTTRNVLIRRELPPQERVVERAAPVRERVIERAAPVRERVIERAAARGGRRAQPRREVVVERAAPREPAVRSLVLREPGMFDRMIGASVTGSERLRVAAGRGRGGAAADLQVRNAGCAAGLRGGTGGRARHRGSFTSRRCVRRRRPVSPFIRCRRVPHRRRFSRPEQCLPLPWPHSAGGEGNEKSSRPHSRQFDFSPRGVRKQRLRLAFFRFPSPQRGEGSRVRGLRQAGIRLCGPDATGKVNSSKATRRSTGDEMPSRSQHLENQLMNCNDPLVAALKDVGYNVVRLPRADIAPLQILVRKRSNLDFLGTLDKLIVGVQAPQPKLDEPVTTVKGQSTRTSAWRRTSAWGSWARSSRG